MTNPTKAEHDLESLIDTLKTEMIISQALIDVLIDKGIMSHEELQAKIKQIKIKSGILLSSSSESSRH